MKNVMMYLMLVLTLSGCGAPLETCTVTRLDTDTLTQGFISLLGGKSPDQPARNQCTEEENWGYYWSKIDNKAFIGDHPTINVVELNFFAMEKVLKGKSFFRSAVPISERNHTSILTNQLVIDYSTDQFTSLEKLYAGKNPDDYLLLMEPTMRDGLVAKKVALYPLATNTVAGREKSRIAFGDRLDSLAAGEVWCKGADNIYRNCWGEIKALWDQGYDFYSVADDRGYTKGWGMPNRLYGNVGAAIEFVSRDSDDLTIGYTVAKFVDLQPSRENWKTLWGVAQMDDGTLFDEQGVHVEETVSKAATTYRGEGTCASSMVIHEILAPSNHTGCQDLIDRVINELEREGSYARDWNSYPSDLTVLRAINAVATESDWDTVHTMFSGQMVYDILDYLEGRSEWMGWTYDQWDVRSVL